MAMHPSPTAMAPNRPTRYVRESLRLNLQQRHIAQRIAADDLRRIRAPVVQLDGHIVRALYDVVVRHDVAVFRQHESAAHNRGRRRLPKHVCRHLGCNAAHRVYVDAVDLLRGQRLAAVVGSEASPGAVSAPSDRVRRLIPVHWPPRSHPLPAALNRRWRYALQAR